jgi:drug/metabolite transporter (DMT)-like permease
MCIASAAGFGAMAVFGKLAYDEGVTVGTLLSARFALAALLFWGLVLVSRDGAAGLRSVQRRDLLIALGLGAFGYAAQAGCFFAALDRIDASLLSLLLYTYPSMVAIAAILLRRERADARRFTALVLASAGLVLVLANAKAGTLDAVGAGLAIAAALVYTTYILTSQGIAGRMSPVVLSALVCTGATVTLTAATAAIGDLHPAAVTPAGWGWLLSLAVVSTVAAVSLFFAGLKRVGPTSAAILSTAEPVTTVILAYLVFGEVLGPLQLLGGGLVIVAVLVLATHRPLREPQAVDVDHAAPGAVDLPASLVRLFQEDGGGRPGRVGQPCGRGEAG